VHFASLGKLGKERVEMVHSTAEVSLTRTVRFAVNFNADKDLDVSRQRESQRDNTFAAAPGLTGIGAYYEIEITCRGLPDPATGYLINISALDRAVRQRAVPVVQHAVLQRTSESPGDVLRDVLESVRQDLGAALSCVRWRLTPYYSLAMSAGETDRVSITQSFEFAAAHRLHVPDLDDARNREIFGKCNNPSGHGHNYRVEVTVAVPIAVHRNGSGAGKGANGLLFTLRTLEGIVMERVIDRFDHKHLNRDTAEFANLNPSVENIARVCHGLLEQPIGSAGGELQCVTVWETEKTRCTYPAEAWLGQERRGAATLSGS
jgi:6-pyruvoyltetrahydropterin/6-carboxytetrahydropterin synthase